MTMHLGALPLTKVMQCFDSLLELNSDGYGYTSLQLLGTYSCIVWIQSATQHAAMFAVLCGEYCAKVVLLCCCSLMYLPCCVRSRHALQMRDWVTADLPTSWLLGDFLHVLLNLAPHIV